MKFSHPIMESIFCRAVRMRKVLGGGWRQPGCLANAAMVAMDTMVTRMQRDHQNARLLAEGEQFCLCISHNGSADLVLQCYTLHSACISYSQCLDSAFSPNWPHSVHPGIAGHSSGIVKVDVDGVHTNIVLVNTIKEGFTAAQFCDRLASVSFDQIWLQVQSKTQPLHIFSLCTFPPISYFQQVSDQELVDLKESIIIKSLAFFKNTARFVIYSDITAEHIEKALKKIHYVLDELSQWNSLQTHFRHLCQVSVINDCIIFPLAGLYFRPEISNGWICLSIIYEVWGLVSSHSATDLLHNCYIYHAHL